VNRFLIPITVLVFALVLGQFLAKSISYVKVFTCYLYSAIRYKLRNGQSTQHIINAHYNQRLFALGDLTTKYEANTCLALPNACRRSLRAPFLL
jgi:uncharacterized membrane protein